MSFTRGLLLVSQNVLVGILLSLRFVVLPSLRLLPADEITVFMGRLMIRARKALLALGLICAVAALRYVIGGERSVAKLSLLVLFLMTIALLGIPPGWTWYPKLLPRRRMLLDAGLATGILTMTLLWLPTK